MPPRLVAIALLCMVAACGSDGGRGGSGPAAPSGDDPGIDLDNVGNLGDAAGDRPAADGGDATASDGTSAGAGGDPATPAEPASARTMTVSASGDVLPHSPLWRQAARDAGGGGYDFGPMFADIAPVLAAADLAICHLETPIAPEGEEYTTSPLYGVPPEVVDAIAGAGFDRCSTASNHAFDRGVAGIERTIDVLEAAGVDQSGMARSAIDALPTAFDVNGIRVGHLSYTFGLNGNYVPPGQEWRVPLIDAPRIIGDALAVRAQGAEVVIASLHWGTEGEAAPDADQRAVAEAITASGAIDLVIGHHAHVLQPIEQVNGVWVAFGLGNILSNLPVGPQWPAASQDAAIVEFPIVVTGSAAGGDLSVDVGPPTARPTWVDKDRGWVVRDVLADLDDPATGDSARRQLEESLRRTAQMIGPYVVPNSHAS